MCSYLVPCQIQRNVPISVYEQFMSKIFADLHGYGEQEPAGA